MIKTWWTGSRDTMCRIISPSALPETQNVACTFGLRQLIISHRGEVTAKITQWLSLSMKKERPGCFKCLTCEVQGDHLVTCAAAWASWTQGAQPAHGELSCWMTGRHIAWTKNWPLAGRHWTDSTLKMVGNVCMDISKCMALHQKDNNFPTLQLCETCSCVTPVAVWHL
jgi:hypothetical protein